MIRTDQYKYCVFDSGINRKQLYDLKNDPGEMVNLATDEKYKEIVKKHHQILKEWIAPTSDTIGEKYM